MSNPKKSVGAMSQLHCFRNPKTGEVRTVLGIQPGIFAVVKFFRTDSEVFSVKVWSGDLNKTMSYWSTTQPVKGTKATEYFALARHAISTIANILSPFIREEAEGDA